MQSSLGVNALLLRLFSIIIYIFNLLFLVILFFIIIGYYFGFEFLLLLPFLRGLEGMEGGKGRR